MSTVNRTGSLPARFSLTDYGRTACFGEYGASAASLRIPRRHNSADVEQRPIVAYHALEVIAVCAAGRFSDRFIKVPQALERDDDIIRVLAMRLVARADRAQLEAASQLVGTIACQSDAHSRGLFMLANYQVLQFTDVQRFLKDEDPIARMHGAIAAKHLCKRYPELLRIAAKLSDEAASRSLKCRHNFCAVAVRAQFRRRML